MCKLDSTRDFPITSCVQTLTHSKSFALLRVLLALYKRPFSFLGLSYFMSLLGFEPRSLCSTNPATEGDCSFTLKISGTKRKKSKHRKIGVFNMSADFSFHYLGCLSVPTYVPTWFFHYHHQEYGLLSRLITTFSSVAAISCLLGFWYNWSLNNMRLQRPTQRFSYIKFSLLFFIRTSTRKLHSSIKHFNKTSSIRVLVGMKWFWKAVKNNNWNLIFCFYDRFHA